MNRDSSPSGSPLRPGASSRRGRWLLLLLPLVLGAGGLLFAGHFFSGAPAGTEAPAPRAPAPPREAPAPREPARWAPGASARPLPPATPLSPEEAEREEQRRQAQARLDQARFTLDTYRQGTRYPPESRPISDEPDQVYPASPERKQPLGKDKGNFSLRLKQEKVFVVGDETVRFFVGCENANTGEPVQCEVHSANAHEAPHMAEAGQLSAVPLDFNDSGRGGDEVAGDGTWTGSFQPSRQGFALFEGSLRVEFRVRANGNTEGGSFFDISFTPTPPATFTGKVREVVEQGSLQLYVGLQVRKPGRYVMAARVDDEAGVPFSYASFNDELTAGTREVKFTVFGALLRDKNPDYPLKLRDVEGFLLRERGDPDRECSSRSPATCTPRRNTPRIASPRTSGRARSGSATSTSTPGTWTPPRRTWTRSMARRAPRPPEHLVTGLKPGGGEGQAPAMRLLPWLLAALLTSGCSTPRTAVVPGPAPSCVLDAPPELIPVNNPGPGELNEFFDLPDAPAWWAPAPMDAEREQLPRGPRHPARGSGAAPACPAGAAAHRLCRHGGQARPARGGELRPGPRRKRGQDAPANCLEWRLLQRQARATPCSSTPPSSTPTSCAATDGSGCTSRQAQRGGQAAARGARPGGGGREERVRARGAPAQPPLHVRPRAGRSDVHHRGHARRHRRGARPQPHRRAGLPPMREHFGLRGAWLTNGLDSIHYSAEDFGRLSAWE